MCYMNTGKDLGRNTIADMGINADLVKNTGDGQGKNSGNDFGKIFNIIIKDFGKIIGENFGKSAVEY